MYIKSFNQFINESYYGDIKQWYRGVNSNYDIGSSPDTWIWITDTLEHAKEYGDKVAQFDFDYEKYETKIAYSELENLLIEYAKKNNKEIDEHIYDVKWDTTKEFSDFLKSKGYIGYQFEAEGGTRLCILDKSLLKNPIEVK